MAAKACTVTVQDVDGLVHSVDVTADSLYEAACAGLQALKASGWADAVGPATKLEVEVRAPVTRHKLTVQQVQQWVAGAAKSPNEQVMKDRLKKMLAAR